MKMSFREVGLKVLLMGTVFGYAILPSYGMDGELEPKRIQEFRAKMKGKHRPIRITSLSPLEQRIKGKDDQEKEASTLRKAAQSLKKLAAHDLVLEDPIIALWVKTAQKGHFASRYNLGWVFQQRKGPFIYLPSWRQRPYKLFYWEIKAQYEDNPGRWFRLGRLYWGSKAMECYLKAADKGHAVSKYLIGEFYRLGIGVSIDYAQAMEWYLKLAEKNYAEGYISLGTLYEAGEGGIKQNSEEASKWFNQAIAKDIKYAINIGDLFSGARKEINQDLFKAFRWYIKAAEQNNAEGQFKSGICGLTLDPEEAAKWLTKAVAQDVKYAKKIGDMYKAGWLPHPFSKSITKDSTKALKWYLLAAEQNDTEAQIEAGILYESGKGTEQNSEEAERWFTKAATQDIGCAYKVGNLYYEGWKIRKDYTKALEWYLKAANKDYGLAQLAIGQLYEEGEGVKRDPEKAAEFFEETAKYHPHMSSASAIGAIYYSSGEKNQGNYKKALMWYLRAAKQGFAHAQFRIGMLYEGGKEIEQHSEKAAEWFMKAARQNSSYARALGDLFYEGKEGVQKDDANALKWFLMAAEKGSVSAQIKVGTLYETGRGTARNSEEAMRWFKKAITGYTLAGMGYWIKDIADLYDEGKDGVEQNYAKAFECYMIGAEQNAVAAQIKVGIFYETGRGIGRNPEEADRWFIQAGSYDFKVACQIGDLYLYGREGVTKDYVKALKWYRKAVETGSKEAQKRIKDIEGIGIYFH